MFSHGDSRGRQWQARRSEELQGLQGLSWNGDASPHRYGSLLDSGNTLPASTADEEAGTEAGAGQEDPAVEAPAAQRIEQGDGTTDNDDEATAAGNEVNRLVRITRRLRCLFSTITWPIVPLGTVVSVTLLVVLYTAFVVDASQNCSQPLHAYALASFLLVAYTPHHTQLRYFLFRYTRDRDGPIRPPGVRMYDQFFHTLCLLYVYGGMRLMHTCREDFRDNIEPDKDTLESVLNTCEETCPNLFRALELYIATLELFTFALVLPLLVLPCIYIWIVRRAAAVTEPIALLREEMNEAEATVTAQDVMDALQVVKLIQTDDGVVTITEDGTKHNVTGAKECCICMSEFHIDESDEAIESGLKVENAAKPPVDETTPLTGRDIESGAAASSTTTDASDQIVRTKCGHIFHRKCIGGWIGGRWEPRSSRSRRRARRKCCPLCRENLAPNPSSI